MKNKFRTAAWILAAAVLCAMTAGCGNSTGSVQESSGTKEAESAAVATQAEAAPEEPGEEGADAAETVPEAMTAAAAAMTAETASTAAETAAEDSTAAETASTAAETAAEDSAAAETASTAEETAEADSTAEAAAAEEEKITFDGESDLEYNARQILQTDDSITREGALGVAAYLWQMGFGRMSGYPVIEEVEGDKILTVFDEDGLFYNIRLTPEGKIKQVEDVEGNELIALGTRAGERVKPPLSGADVVAVLEEWGNHGGHSQVLSVYNKYAHEYGRSKMSSSDQWCSETVSAAYAALGLADKIGGMASNGNTYEKNARSIGAWVSSKNYIPNAGDILITHDSNGDRHTYCVISCDGHTIKTIAGGGSSIHHSSISVGSGRITGFVVPEW